MDLPMKLVIEVPVYRRTTKKLLTLVEKLGQGRIGHVQYNVTEENFEFTSVYPRYHFNISDSYFRNPNGKVEFERFRNFRSAFNLIIAVSNDETDVEVSLIENDEETIKENGIYSNITLTIFTTSMVQFKKIAQHLELLGSS